MQELNLLVSAGAQLLCQMAAVAAAFSGFAALAPSCSLNLLWLLFLLTAAADADSDVL